MSRTSNVVSLPSASARQRPHPAGVVPVLAEVRARLDRLNKLLAVAEMRQQKAAEATSRADEALCRLGDEIDAMMALMTGNRT